LSATATSPSKQLRKDYFPTAIDFLDIWHLQDRLAGAMGDEVAATELGGLMTLAVNGKVDQIIQRLAELWADQGDDDQKRGLLGDVITYIDANREGIAVYAKYGAQASGAIEKTMDVTVGRRLKAKGTSGTAPVPTASWASASSSRTAAGSATGRLAARAPRSPRSSPPDPCRIVGCFRPYVGRLQSWSRATTLTSSVRSRAGAPGSRTCSDGSR
jgi:hypothetical protein